MTPDAGYSNVLRGTLIGYGLLLVPFALEMNRRFRVVRPWKLFFVLGIWAHIALMMAAAIFQNDSSMSVLGLVEVDTLHDAGTVALFTTAMLTLIVAWLSAGKPQWPLHTRYSWASLAVMVAMGSILMVSAFTDFQGITERASTGAFMGWILLTAVCQCLKQEGSQRSKQWILLDLEEGLRSRADHGLAVGGETDAAGLAPPGSSEAAG